MNARLDFVADDLKGLRQDFNTTLRALEPALSGIRQDLAGIKAAMPHLAAKADLSPYLTTRGLATFIGLLALLVGLGVTGFLWFTNLVVYVAPGASGGPTP